MKKVIFLLTLITCSSAIFSSDEVKKSYEELNRKLDGILSSTQSNKSLINDRGLALDQLRENTNSLSVNAQKFEDSTRKLEAVVNINKILVASSAILMTGLLVYKLKNK